MGLGAAPWSTTKFWLVPMEAAMKPAAGFVLFDKPRWLPPLSLPAARKIAKLASKEGVEAGLKLRERSINRVASLARKVSTCLAHA